MWKANKNKMYEIETGIKKKNEINLTKTQNGNKYYDPLNNGSMFNH